MDPRIKVAREHLDNNKINDAARIILALLQEQPEKPTVQHLAGLLSLQTGDPYTARRRLEIALQNDPADPGLRRDLAQAVRHAGNDKHAEDIENVTDAIEVLRFVDELVLFNEERLSQVIKDTEEELRSIPGNFTTYVLQTFALLAIIGKNIASPPELAQRLGTVDWLYKKQLYSYWTRSIPIHRPRAAITFSIIVTASNQSYYASNRDLDRCPPTFGRPTHELIFVTDENITEDRLASVQETYDTVVVAHAGAGAFLLQNLGATFASAPYLLFLDAGTRAPQDLLESHLIAHTKHDPISVTGPLDLDSAEDIEAKPHENHLTFLKRLDQKSNVSFYSQTFFEIGGWPDHFLGGRGAKELSRRLLERSSSPGSQIHTTAARVGEAVPETSRGETEPCSNHDYLSSIFLEALKHLHPQTLQNQTALSLLDGLTTSGKVTEPLMRGEPIFTNKIDKLPRSCPSRTPRDRLAAALGSRSIVFVIAGNRGNYGLIDAHNEALALATRARGIPVEILDARMMTENELAAQLARNAGKQFLVLGNRYYQLSLADSNRETKNVFDQLSIPATAIIGDHPFSPFMHESVKDAARSLLYLSPCQSLIDEMLSIRPDLCYAEACRSFPVKEPPAYVIPHQARQIDVLIPLGMEKFTNVDKSHLDQTLKEVDPRLPEVFQSLINTYSLENSQPLLETFSSLLKAQLGYAFDPSRKDTTTEVLLQSLAYMDWQLRIIHRRNALAKLMPLFDPNRHTIRITAPTAVIPQFPELADLPPDCFIGQQSHDQMRGLYNDSRLCLNVNPTYPDQIHERLRYALTSGCTAITTPSLAINNCFSNRESLLLVDDQAAVRIAIENPEYSEAIGLSGRSIAGSSFSWEPYLNELFLSWASYLQRFNDCIND